MARLQWLAEVDTLLDRLRRWADSAPTWQPAETARALVRRLDKRASGLKVRLAAPLVVATLGGTGTGKSALVNALVGAEVVRTGRQRPTTIRPAMICRPGTTPESLGIDPQSVEPVYRDLPALAELVLIDCPDPDTTEENAAHEVAGSNLARLRQILPHCDVLLVTTTQQKYRSARVADELTAAASGTRLVFVQTHGDVDEDIREDWQAVLEDQYTTGRLFLVDSLSALADAENGLAPRGPFAALVDLLTRQLAGTAAARIRRANFLDLIEETLARSRERIDEAMPAIERLREAIEQQRIPLAAALSRQMRSELLSNRRQWENRLLGRAAARWGLSPFALVLRVFHGLGGLLAGRLLWRARTPAQIALWGAVQGARTWRKSRRQRAAEQGPRRAVTGCWDRAELRKAAVILGGYAAEAGLEPDAVDADTVAAEADRAGVQFVAETSGQLESLVARLAQRHTGWFTRWRYELLLAAMLGFVLYRLGKNFFYDSWLAERQLPVFGFDFYVSAGFWLLLWCLVLIWLFTGRLRRGLRREIDQLAGQWQDPASAAGIFARLEEQCRQIGRFRRELDRLGEHVDRLRRELAGCEEKLGYRQ